MKFSLKLPQSYRSREILAFHARDPEGLAEQVEEDHFRKGFVLNDIPVAIDIFLRSRKADCEVLADGILTATSSHALERIARNLLGLTIDPDPFEAITISDPLLGRLVAKQKGLRIPQTATPFEAITWAVIGQQINLPFAVALRRILIVLAGKQHSSGLWCYPDAAAVARLNPHDLGQRKFSRAKAETLVRLARMIEKGELPLDRWQDRPPEEIGAALLGVKGIGPWTVNYSLLRGFGYADCSLHSDAAIRNALHRLNGGGNKSDKPSLAKTQLVLDHYKPHRSLAAAHLWTSLNVSTE